MDYIYGIRGRISLIFLLLFFFTLQFNAFAQTGSVRGTITDKTSEEPLIGANIIIKGTSLGAATDFDGNYIIRGIPSGTHQIIVSYIGYNSITTDLTISENRTLEQSFSLEPITLEGQEVEITAQAEGQLSAINQQLSSNTIANVVSKDRIKELPDVNAAETIGRLPGISIERSGGEATKISIRGLEPKYNTITVNGVRVPATDSDNRSVDLSLISSNMLDGITVKKANTPDMDADALGGTVDLRLKEAPEGLHINASAQSGYNQLQDYYGNYAFTGSISNRFFNNDLGVIVNFNLDNYDRSADKFEGNYEQTGSGANITVKPQQILLRDESIKRGRAGASILLDYRIPAGKVTANSFYNNLHTDGLTRVNNMDVSHNSHYYDLEDREGNTSIFTGALGIEQDFEWIKYDFTISKSQSIIDNPNDYVWGFVQENSSFNTSAVTPGMDPHFIPEFQTIDTSITGFRNAFIYSDSRKEDDNALQLNFQMPYNFGSDIKGYLKFGGKFRYLSRNRNQEQYGRDNIQYGGVGLNDIVSPVLRYLSEKYPENWNWESDSALARSNAVFPISRFLTNESAGTFLNGEYTFGFMVNDQLLNQFTEALRNTTSDNWLYYYMGSEGYDYDGFERYTAGYVMTEVNFLNNFITFIPGFRYEKDYSNYNGRRFREIDNAGVQQEPRDFEKINNVRENEFWLPMVHLTINPYDWLKIRLARTETLTRPDYIQYAPLTTMDRFNSYIRANNGSLKPAKSTNYDASIQVFENYTGFFTISGFYKEIDNLIFQASYKLLPGIPVIEGANVPDDWRGSSPTMDTYINNPNPAFYRGIEFEWQTRFWYLPSFLQGIVLNINYTRIFSDVDKQIFIINRIVNLPPRPPTYTFTDSIRSGRMPYQPAHILNITFGYDFKGFSGRVSYLYQTDKTTYVATYPGLDESTGTYARWDLSLQQKLDWGLQVFANFSNLNKRADRTFRSNSETNASYTEYYGFTMDLGVRYNF